MTPFEDEHFTVNVKVGVSPLFFGWVAPFLDAIQIIAPQRAVILMCAFIMNLSNTYLDSDNMQMLQKAIKDAGKMP